MIGEFTSRIELMSDVEFTSRVKFISRVICAMLKFVEGDLFLAFGLPLLVAAGLGCLFSTSFPFGLLLFPLWVSGLELTRLSIVKGEDLFLPVGGVALRVGVR